MALSRAARVIGGRRVFRVTERRGFVSGACQALLRSAEARAARTVLGSAGVLLSFRGLDTYYRIESRELRTSAAPSRAEVHVAE
jgi:hypothetical protein